MLLFLLAEMLPWQRVVPQRQLVLHQLLWLLQQLLLLLLLLHLGCLKLAP